MYSEVSFSNLACNAHAHQDGGSKNGGAIEGQIVQTPRSRGAQQRLRHPTVEANCCGEMLRLELLRILCLEGCEQHYKGRNGTSQEKT